MATNAEIWAAQQRRRAEAEARKTLPDRLMDPKVNATGEASRLMAEAAEALRWYVAEIARMRREAIEEEREAQRDARSAYTQGRWDAEDEQRGGY